MKSIPMFFLNKDRFVPPKQLVEAMVKRGYHNIVILDNGTTYDETLEWYDNLPTLYDNCVQLYTVPEEVGRYNDALLRLANHGIEPFRSILKEHWFVYSDADVVPVNELPDDFINDMIFMGNHVNAPKTGWSYKLDDIPDYYSLKEMVVNHESSKFWNNPTEVVFEKYDKINKVNVYPANLDTTFAVYRPGFPPRWTHAGESVRTDFPYQARHIPWYYDTNNLPPDEEYYMEHFNPEVGYGWSAKIKNIRGG